MKTNGLFEIHEYRIPSVVNETINLVPFGDIHRSAPLCHEEKWLEFLGHIKTLPNLYLMGMGDYDDLCSSSERQALVSAQLHDSTVQTVEAMYRKNIDLLINELSFGRGKFIGLLEGNHYVQLPNGTTSTQRMCEFLECKYLGCMAFVRLVFEMERTSITLDIFAHHGLGAARLLGGSLNRVQQMAESAIADLYLMGHDHKLSVAPINRLQLTNTGTLHLLNRKGYVARTGSFLRGFVPGQVSYVADRALNPSTLGAPVFQLTPRRVRTDGDDYCYVDIHAVI